jgi:hypothetical protein
MALLLRILPIVALTLSWPARAQDLSAGDMREDLRYLEQVWSHTDRSLTPERREKFDAAIQETSRRVSTLTTPDFALEVSRIVAIARNGHSQAQIDDRLSGLPLGFAWFEDGLFIVRADARHRELLGSRVERFGSLTAEEACTRTRKLIPGSDAWARNLAAVYLRALEVLRFIGATDRVDVATLQLRLPDGRGRRVRLEKESAPDPSPVPAWMGTVPAPPDVAGRWLHVLDNVRKRPSLYRDVTNLDREWMRDNRVFYVRSNYIYGTAANRYELNEKLIGILQVEVAERRPRFAIIDLRLNHGGDFFNTVVFASALPRLIPADGRIFVLVGPDTFSAAIATAAMIKAQGGDRVVFVGDVLGDDAEFWSEGPPVTLPHSGIVVTSGTRKHNWSAACVDSPDCYWGNVAFGPAGISLEPNIRVKTRFADYATGHDPVLEAALNAAR